MATHSSVLAWELSWMKEPVASSVKRGAWETQPGHRACNPIIIPWKHLWGPASTLPPFVLH